MNRKVFTLEELSPEVKAETIDRFRDMFTESACDNVEAILKASDDQIVELMNNAPYRLFYADGTTVD